MKEEYINTFLSATQEVFQLMLDVDIDKDRLDLIDQILPTNDTNVAIDIIGDLRGTVLLGIPKSMTLEMVKIMSGMEIMEIDSFVSSALGEVANIIGGSALTKLSESSYKCDITSPKIILGKDESIVLDSGKTLQIFLKSPIGEFDMKIKIT